MLTIEAPQSCRASAASQKFPKQALKCQEERGLIPNVVAVNFYEIADVLAVVDAPNGMEADAQER